MLKFICVLSSFLVFFYGDAMENGHRLEVVFANHTDFSYTVDASSLRMVELFRLNREKKQEEKIERVEIAPAVETDFTLGFDNRGNAEDKDGNLIDYGKIVVCKSGEFSRHMIDVTFKAQPYSAYVSPFIIGNDERIEYVDKDGRYSNCWYPLYGSISIPKGFVDEQKEFAVTSMYVPKARKWGKHFVFSVEKYEEGKETYIDLDQFLMTADELRERDRKLLHHDEKDVGCCGLFRKKRSNK